jgi:hypothetical protein
MEGSSYRSSPSDVARGDQAMNLWRQRYGREVAAEPRTRTGAALAVRNRTTSGATCNRRSGHSAEPQPLPVSGRRCCFEAEAAVSLPGEWSSAPACCGTGGRSAGCSRLNANGQMCDAVHSRHVLTWAVGQGATHEAGSGCLVSRMHPRGDSVGKRSRNGQRCVAVALAAGR